ncbi:hypothetical protein J2S92_001797 [Arthrobacter bambusae]|nr:hypothetical protein [Arthrobacter bambusae]MDQ0234431.1 hypothetical protein [Arthrobacter bambusae]
MVVDIRVPGNIGIFRAAIGLCHVAGRKEPVHRLRKRFTQQ